MLIDTQNQIIHLSQDEADVFVPQQRYVGLLGPAIDHPTIQVGKSRFYWAFPLITNLQDLLDTLPESLPRIYLTASTSTLH